MSNIIFFIGYKINYLKQHLYVEADVTHLDILPHASYSAGTENIEPNATDNWSRRTQEEEAPSHLI